MIANAARNGVGKVVLVTGATDGLGKGLACALAELGATVLLHGRSEARLADTAAEIFASAPTAEVRTYRADFGTLTEVADMAATIREREPRLDVLLAGYLLVRDLSELLAASVPAVSSACRSMDGSRLR